MILATSQLGANAAPAQAHCRRTNESTARIATSVGSLRHAEGGAFEIISRLDASAGVGGAVVVSDPSIVAPPQRAATAEQVEWLVARFGATLFRIAFAIVRDRQAAEDVVQEVLVKAWTSMPSWDGDVPIRWTRTVTRNTALSHVRAGRARPSDPTDHLDLVVSSARGPDEAVVDAETAQSMWAALGRLGAEERSMLVLHEVDGVSYEELAATFGLTVSAVKSKLYRARIALRSEVVR